MLTLGGGGGDGVLYALIGRVEIDGPLSFCRVPWRMSVVTGEHVKETGESKNGCRMHVQGFGT
jgi:hypothetical protein